PRGGPVPLSFAEQRLWFLDRLGSGAGYQLSGALHLRGRLEVSALGAALTEIVRRHEALRATFPAVDGEAVQRIGEPRPLPVPLDDVSGAGDPAAEARRLCGEHVLEPFDLEHGPLFRARLLRLGNDEPVL